MPLSRRRFLVACGGTVLTVTGTGCGFVRQDTAADDPDTLSFTTWGTSAELAGFRELIARFTGAHSGVRVVLNVVPYENFFTNIDALLQSGTAPDIFRVDYDTFGVYAGARQLLELTPHLPAGFGTRFTPAMWRAVQNGGVPYGVPHHTDTSVILYNVEALRSAGITGVPTELGQAWTWEEFDQVARRLRAVLPPAKFPFVVNWQSTGVTRWLSWLFEADGRYLAPDLLTPAIDSEAGRAALDFTRGFFTHDLVPPNSSVKSTTYASDTWYAQTTAMTFGGAFLLPDAADTLTFDWAATYAPRRVRSGSDLGGNALVATAGTGKPELAAAFLELATQAEPMRDFCVRASLLPTRADLLTDGLRFSVRPELSPIFLDQASTVRPGDAEQVASPAMDRINTVLSDQLEAAFVGGQSTTDTLVALTEGISTATARAPMSGTAIGTRRRRRGLAAGEAKAAWLFLAPYLVLLGLFLLLPLAWALLLSFGQTNGFGEARWAGLDNYLRLVTDPLFWRATLNTALFTALVTPLSMLLGLGAAMLLNSVLPARGLFRSIFILPMAVSGVATALIGTLVFDENNGVLNALLRTLGLPSAQWQSGGSAAFASVVLVTLWWRVGFNMLIYLAGLQNIDPGLYEAARLDGAGRWQRFRHLTVPLVGPSSFFLLIMNVIYSFQVFDIVFVMTGGGPQNATSVLVTYAYDSAFVTRDQGYSAAIGVVLLLLTLGFTAVQWRTNRTRDLAG